MIGFLLIVVTVTGLVHWFLYARLVTALDITSPAALWTLRALAVFLSQSYLLSKVLERTGGCSGLHALEWVSSVWVGVFWQLLWMCLLLYEIKIVLVLTGVWSGFSLEQQVMIGRTSAIAVISAVLVICSYGYYRAASPALVREVRVPVENPSPEVQELKIALVADFHASMLMTEKRVARYCEQISSLNPDLILIPGDIIDTPAKRIGNVAKAFRKLEARLGVYGSTGNHEYYIGPEIAVELIQRGGIRMLINENVELSENLVIAGVEDRTASSSVRSLPDLQSLLGGNDGRVKILLNHTPAKADMEKAIAAGADLVVCGHTHGGQLWPFNLLTKLAFPLHHGLYPVGDGHVLTTSGIGFWGPPMRVGAPPEIMLIRLVPSP